MSDIEAQIQQAAVKNTELLRTLAETDHATPDLVEQDRFIVDLTNQIQRSDKEVRRLDGIRYKEFKEHEKYRDSTVKRFMYKASGKGDRFTERAGKEEREYFDALQKEHQEKEVNANLREQLADATKWRDQLEVEAQRNKNAQTELDHLYNSIFAGPTPQFPGEDDKEKASERTLQAYHDTRTRAEADFHVFKLLNDAIPIIHSSLVSIENALDYSRMDMFGGGGFSDMMERNHLSKAEVSIQKAYRIVDRAREASPAVGNLPRISINHGNLISDVLFDNIFTDMAFHEEIKNSKQQVLRYLQTLQQRTAEAKERHQIVQTELEQRQNELEQARLDLQRERERAFERVAGGGAPGGSRGEAPPSFPEGESSERPPEKQSTNPFGDPPPDYE